MEGQTSIPSLVWQCKHYAGRGEKSFCESGAALAEDMGMPVSKMAESIEARIQASLRTAQDLSVDLSDCANDVQINSLQYCSDQNEIHAHSLEVFHLRRRAACPIIMQFGRREDVQGQWRPSQCDSFLLHRIEIG